MRAPLIISLLLSLSACATIGKEECLNGNWEEIGFRDGTNGRTSDYLQKHAKACSKTGVSPVQSLWEKGRQRGLPAYCVPAEAFSEGKKGNKLRPVCPAPQMSALQAANKNGLEFHELTDDIEQVQYRIDEIDRRVVAEDSSEARAFLLQESRTLSQRIRLLELKRSLIAAP